jgi:hypothetical protein
MIEWFTYAQVGIAVAAGLLCAVLGLLGRPPQDLTMGAALLVEVLLMVQLIVSLAAPAFGNNPTGSLLEFYLYLVSAILLLPLAGVWALMERNRWSTVILGIACFAIAIMVYRMNDIWLVELT